MKLGKTNPNSSSTKLVTNIIEKHKESFQRVIESAREYRILQQNIVNSITDPILRAWAQREIDTFN